MNSNGFPGTLPARETTTAGQRLEGVVLVVILLTVGGFAGAASFTHVHDWTMANSPADTGDWFGWANAVVSELVPIAALLVMRRRRRAGQSIAYPAFLLVCALALSVTAQLAVAKPGLSGGLVSVVPALAFAALAKLVLGKTPKPERQEPVAVTEVSPQVSEYVPSVPDDTTGTEDDHRELSPSVPANKPVASAWPPPPLPAQLLDRARAVAEQHHAETGRAISRDELQKILRVSNATTGEVMRALHLREAPRQLTAATAVSPLTGRPLI